ncbi:hypothetical protein AFM16_26115 [Streptomyces antibioticus]|uniref:Transposase n=1 Tax=Streptomyces antibioticus TaxID=1890 RepID=A0ABX3LFY5_STRAT|nr:hypothetical protein AFM16_26115 [Streptomyces antibioticus]
MGDNENLVGGAQAEMTCDNLPADHRLPQASRENQQRAARAFQVLHDPLESLGLILAEGAFW